MLRAFYQVDEYGIVSMVANIAYATKIHMCVHCYNWTCYFSTISEIKQLLKDCLMVLNNTKNVQFRLRKTSVNVANILTLDLNLSFYFLHKH